MTRKGPARCRKGPEGSEGLEMVFADAYTLANESFERHLEIETATS